MINLSHLAGKFISFEGGEGSGKTTLVNQLFFEFQKQKIPVIKTHDPGGTAVSKEIRKILLSKDSKIDVNTEMLLFSASRAQLTSEVILPALKTGTTIICDRFFDSTKVYQGMLRHHDISMLQSIFDYTCDITPDITFLMNVDAEIGLKRSYEILNNENVDESKFEDYGLVFHKKVNKAFLDLAYDDNYYLPHLSRIKIIDANKSLEYCLGRILDYLSCFKLRRNDDRIDKATKEVS